MTKKAVARQGRKEAVRQLSGLDDGRKKLGYVLWWTIAQNLNIKGDKAIDIFKNKGFPENELPIPLEADIAFGRAAKKGSQKLAGWLIRKVYHGEDRITYAVVKEKIDEANEDAIYNREDRITLHRKTADVTAQKNLVPSKEIKDIYKTTLGNVDNWRCIDFLLKQTRVMGALQLRDMGGIYFIPIQYEDKLNLVEEGLGELSPESVLYLLPIYDDKKAQSSLKTAFIEDYRKELASMGEELEKRIEAGGTRASTFQNRLTEYKELRERARAYEDLLQFKAKDVHDAIDKMEAQVKEALASAIE